MTDQPSKGRLFGRQAPPPPKLDVQGFLNGLVENSPEVQAMRDAIYNADRDISGLNERVKVLEQEIRRVGLMRDEWMSVANEMQIQLEVISNTAASAAEQSTNASISVANQAKRALQAAKEKLAKSGMAMTSPTIHSKVTDEQTKKIAEMLSRRPSDGTVQREEQGPEVPDNEVR